MVKINGIVRGRDKNNRQLYADGYVYSEEIIFMPIRICSLEPSSKPMQT